MLEGAVTVPGLAADALALLDALALPEAHVLGISLGGVVAHRLRGLRAPTLVIHGSADELLAPINGDLVASLIPGARLELLDGLGHLFFWEEPQRSAELVRAFALSAWWHARGITADPERCRVRH